MVNEAFNNRGSFSVEQQVEDRLIVCDCDGTHGVESFHKWGPHDPRMLAALEKNRSLPKNRALNPESAS